MPTFFAVFARPYSRPGDLDFLALYSSPDLAQQFIDCQDENLRGCLMVVDIAVDRHPTDGFWKRPGETAA